MKKMKGVKIKHSIHMQTVRLCVCHTKAHCRHGCYEAMLYSKIIAQILCKSRNTMVLTYCIKGQGSEWIVVQVHYFYITCNLAESFILRDLLLLPLLGLSAFNHEDRNSKMARVLNLLSTNKTFVRAAYRSITS